jgi:hypothetical protein
MHSDQQVISTWRPGVLNTLIFLLVGLIITHQVLQEVEHLIGSGPCGADPLQSAIYRFSIRISPLRSRQL